MFTSLRLILPAATIIFALAATNEPLAAQLSTAASSKPLATPAPSPEAGSLKRLLGEPERDAVGEERRTKPTCSLQQCDASVSCVRSDSLLSRRRAARV